MKSDTGIVQDLLLAISSGDTRRQERIFAELDEKFLADGVIHPEVFSALCEGLGDAAVLASEESASLVKIFEYNADLLDEEQRTRVTACLEAGYGNFKDPASSILTVELIVDLLAEEAALAVLSRLRRIRDEFPRATAVYGIRRLGKKVRNSAFIGQVVAEIANMKNDPSQLVRQEVGRSLSELDGGSTTPA